MNLHLSRKELPYTYGTRVEIYNYLCIPVKKITNSTTKSCKESILRNFYLVAKVFDIKIKFNGTKEDKVGISTKLM